MPPVRSVWKIAKEPNRGVCVGMAAAAAARAGSLSQGYLLPTPAPAPNSYQHRIAVVDGGGLCSLPLPQTLLFSYCMEDLWRAV